MTTAEPLCYLVRFEPSHILNGDTLLAGRSRFGGDIYLIGRGDMKLVEKSGLRYRNVPVTTPDTTEAFKAINAAFTLRELQS